MSTIQKIYEAIDSIAPFSLAMDFDNPGLLVGNRSALVRKALLVLDCTGQAVELAQELGASLIITHHPVIFHPLKQVNEESLVYQLISRRIGVVSAHTNLDIARDGVNDHLARVIGLTQVEGLSPVASTPYRKVAVFVPQSHAQAVREAMAQAGAGQLGNYDSCAFLTPGAGFFRPLEGASPFLGEVGRQEQVEEVRVEMICPPGLTGRVIDAMRQAHPYEEPAFDLFEDHALTETCFLGRVGQLERPLSAQELARWVKDTLRAASVRYVDGGRPIRRVAVCGGSGGDLTSQALASGADALLTADVKHDQFLQAAHQGLTLLDAGHFDTEDVVLEPLARRLAKLVPDVEFVTCHHSPIRAV